MGHARYVGRIGALAVALGIGYAVATTPGIALAAPTDAGTTSSTTNGETATAPEDTDTATPGVTESQTVAEDDGAGSGAENDAEDDGGEDEIADDGDPVADAATERRGSDKPDRDLDTVRDKKFYTIDGNETIGDTIDGNDDNDDIDQNDDNDDNDAGTAITMSQKASREHVETFSIDATTEAAARSLSLTTVSTPPVAVVPAPPPDLEEILEEPHTFLVGVVTHVVDAMLEPLLAPFAPGGPGVGPVLWTMLAYVRDEFRRIVFPGMSADPASSSLVEAPNLLVNPGAELGDPSLSAYSTVTVPGWAATGTPTVIKYGTLRRFPVPTSSPGPTLPGLLAFPGQGDAGSGEQFFGGGPVADATLTQIVDLSAAADTIDLRPGGVQYQLSGDLGGFLIDPSRARVTVDFLDGQGVTLGSGALAPITALDRWFMTDLIHRESVGRIPVGARSARVVVAFDDHNPVLGNYNNAYADNLSFKVDAEGLAPAPLAPPPSTVGPLDHVFMVYLENKGVSQIVGSPNAPYINELINTYGYASNYYGLTHPSDPNYTPVIGGSDFGFNYNCPSNCFPVGTPNLADTIEAAGLTWAGYAEGGGGYTTPTDRLPFLAFTDIYNNPQRVATHLFDISELGQDLADPATAPNFVWFAADDEFNMEGPTDFPGGIFHWALGFLNPAHQYNVAAGDQWLRGPLTTILDSPTWQDPTRRSAIVVTFDEDYNNLTTGVGNEGNRIVTVVIPSQGAVAAGMRDGHFIADDHYDHYSLLRTIEDSLGLPRLTNNDRFAYPMNEFWVLP
jgi:hypothetical protein